jgi:hypothetical protein
LSEADLGIALPAIIILFHSDDDDKTISLLLMMLRSHVARAFIVGHRKTSLARFDGSSVRGRVAIKGCKASEIAVRRASSQ